MKAVLAVAILLAASSVEALEKCVYAVVAPNLHSLATPIAKCMTATGNSYNLARAEAPPTAEQAAAICYKCGDFVAAVTALPPWPECTLNVGGSDQTLTSYFDKMIGGCESSTAESSSTTPAAPAATTAAPVAPSAEPASTKPATATTSSGSRDAEIGSAGSVANASASAANVSAPVVGSSTPVPSPTSAATSMSAVATGAVAVGTAALVFV